MCTRVLLIAVVLCVLSPALADNWAVVVAGSNGFWNYRHQADACHAFQILKARGVPSDNIIMMFYDDIANDPSNPFPGKIFNKPSTGPGVDVYDGCQKDYTGADVTPSNFLAVLTGDASKVKGGNGKVLKSGPNDRVFINFVDHGGVGIIAFPDGDLLHADDLVATLKTMHSKNMFSELVFYMEACESGSMFTSLPTNIKVYATTAANGDESSWGTYCPPQDSVDGKELNTCLGDLYSVNWMENTDAQHAMSETLNAQFDAVKKATNQSHVCEFGDESFTSDPIGDFMGNNTEAKRVPHYEPLETVTKWDSRDVKLNTLNEIYWSTDPTNHELQRQRWKAFTDEWDMRKRVDTFFRKFVEHMDSDNSQDLFESHTIPTQWACIKSLNTALRDRCDVWSDYGRQYHRVVVNVCEAGHSANHALHWIEKHC